MDSRTGKIISEEELNNLPEEERKNFIPLNQSEKNRLEKLPPQQRVKSVRLSKIVNKPCPCGSGKKYKKCHLEQDIEVQKALQFVNPTTKKIHCQLGGEEFVEGDKIDWIYYHNMKIDVPVCPSHKEEYLNERRHRRK